MRSSLAILSLSLLACLAVAGPATAGKQVNMVPQGPGTVFESVEAAAIDGLAFAHSRQLESRNKRVSRGGAVVPVKGGFTYGELDVAKPGAPDMIRLRLPKSALAHFHTYPTQNSGADRLNESHSKADRALVDYRDSQKRPSYVLTPSLRVVLYRGREVARRMRTGNVDPMVVDLTQPFEIQRIAASN